MGRMAQVRRILWDAWWRKTLVIIAILVGLYAALGFLAVPAIVQWQLPKQVAQHTTAQASIDSVAFNPFTFDFRASGFTMTSTQGQTLVRFKKLDVNFDPLRMVQGALAFSRIHLVDPYVNAVINKRGRMNFTTLVRPDNSSAEKTKENHELPTIVVDNLAVTGGHVAYSDLSHSRNFHLALKSVDFHLQDFSTRPKTNGAYHFNATLGDGQSLTWQGKIGVSPLRSRGRIRIQGLHLAQLWPYIANRFKVTLERGTLGVRAHYTARMGTDGFQLKINNGSVRLDSLALVKESGSKPLIAVPELKVEGIDFNLQKRRVTIDSVTTQGGRIKATLTKNHQINLARLLMPKATSSKPAPTASKTKSTKPFAITVNSVTVNDYGVAFTDASGPEPVVLHLKPIDIAVTGYSSTNDKPIQISADVGLNGGVLHVDGPVSLDPLGVQLNLKLEHLQLAPFQPYVSRYANLAIKKGTLGVNGRVSYHAGKTAPDIGFNGRVSIHDLKVGDTAHGKPFVRLGELTVKGIQYASQPASLTVEHVILDKPFVRLVVNPDHTTNISAILATGNANKQPSKSQDAHATADGGMLLPVSVSKITIKHGHLDFTDLSMKPDVSIGIEKLHGSVQHFSTQPGNPAVVDLQGEVGPYAPVSIKGTINPLAKSLSADIGLQIQNLGLTAFSPYSAKFAGYRIKKGKVDLTLHYTIHDGLMQGRNKVVLDQFVLGEEVESPDALDLPLRLAVALLKNSHGVIKLNLPVHGDLTSPQFAIGPLIWKVFVNVVTKAVTAPFHWLANLVGANASQLSHVTFAAGQAELSAADKKSLSKLAKALVKRPKLILDVTGMVAPSVDRAALAKQKLLAGIHGSKHGGAQLTEQEAKRVLATYRKTFNADPTALVKRRQDETNASYHARVAAAALERLVAHTQVPDEALRKLAKSRGEAVRHYLVEKAGLDAGRIFLLEAQHSAKATDGSVKIPLKLHAK